MHIPLDYTFISCPCRYTDIGQLAAVLNINLNNKYIYQTILRPVPHGELHRRCDIYVINSCDAYYNHYRQATVTKLYYSNSLMVCLVTVNAEIFLIAINF